MSKITPLTEAKEMLRQHCELLINQYGELLTVHQLCTERRYETVAQLCEKLLSDILLLPRKDIANHGRWLDEVNRRRDDLVAKNKESLTASISVEDVIPNVIPDKDLHPVCDWQYEYVVLMKDQVPGGVGWEPDASYAGKPSTSKRLSYWKRKITRGQSHARADEGGGPEAGRPGVPGEGVQAGREGMGSEGSAEGTDRGGG